MEIQGCDSTTTIQCFHTTIKAVELQFAETLNSLTSKVEEELSKRDAVIKRLTEDNQKLFDQLSQRADIPSSISSKATHHAIDTTTSTTAAHNVVALLASFDPDQFGDNNVPALADGANKLLMLVLIAVLKSGPTREHVMLAEIKDAVFTFIRRLEAKGVLDPLLVFRVRILYIRSLLVTSPELQSSITQPAFEEKMHGFVLNVKRETMSGILSKLLRVRGRDLKQHKRIKEIHEEAQRFAIGNKGVGALFVNNASGALLVQIKTWLAKNFEFGRVSGAGESGRTQVLLDVVSSAILEGWMAGLGAAIPPHTDVLGQLLAEYSKMVYDFWLQKFKHTSHLYVQTQTANAPNAVDSLLQALIDLGSIAEINVIQWNTLQFNTRSTQPIIIIKYGAISNSELVIKADAHLQDPKRTQMVRVIPSPEVLNYMTLEEMTRLFSQLPESLALLALARTADGTCARYSRLYRTLAMKIPSLKHHISELENNGVLKDVKS